MAGLAHTGDIMANRRATCSIALALGLVTAAGACHNENDPAVQSPPVNVGDTSHQAPVVLNVLFIGNSLTYYNDLPGTLASIAAAAGDHIQVEMVAGPRMSLMDHLVPGGDAELAIRDGRWNYVVLQQGASSDLASRDTLILATEEFNTLVRAVGARPALYMVWPPANEPGEFCATRVSYQAAAAVVNGLFLPVGVAWQAALLLTPAVALYDPDGNHPSPVGTYLAAITIYETLTGHDARQLAPSAIVNGAVLVLPTGTVPALQLIAHTASSTGATNHQMCSVDSLLAPPASR